MGSLDVSSAKDQFFMLVDAISTAHLPSFTIWLDAKLAEYKTIGELKPDTESRRNEQYPEWISRSLRQNLSFILPERAEDDSNIPARSPGPRKPHKRRLSNSSASESQVATSDVRQKRRLMSPLDTRERLVSPLDTKEGPAPEETEEERIVIIKEEPVAPETPLPGIQDAFRLISESVPATQDFYSQPESSISSIGVGENASRSFDVAAGASDLPTYRQPSLQEAFGEGGSSLPPRDSSDAAVAKPGAYGSLFNTEAGKPTETDKGSVPCPRCGRAFRSLLSLSRHRASYKNFNFDCNTANPLKTCPVCGKVCKDSYGMKLHRLTHSGLQPYHCAYCDKSYNDRSNCYRHQKLSHADKPRVKVKASVDFSVDLKLHRLTHSGTQPYQCPYCDKSFNDLSNCYRHQNLSHADKPRLKVKASIDV